jgi:predicted transposase YdaD
MQSDHWFHDLFRAMPDLVRHLLPELAAPSPIARPEGTDDSVYTFRPVVLKKQAHSPDGVLWPREHAGGSATWPVVLLEVQMHPDRRFHRRLGAETFRLVQQDERIEHLRVVVLLAHRRLALGSGGPLLLRRFLQQDVTWVDLEALARQPNLDPALALLTLPVQPEADLGPCCQQLLGHHPDWMELILPILCERFTGLSRAEIMTTLRISPDVWRHTRAFQETLEEGRLEGRAEGLREGRNEGHAEGRRREASALALKQLERRCGRLSPAITDRIEALDLPRLEDLALALLDFAGPQDLEEWLMRNGGGDGGAGG